VLTVVFCDVLEYEGPVQLHVTGMVLLVFADKVSALPVQTGLLDPAVGIDGVSFIIIVVVAAAEVQPLSVTVTLYIPDSKTVALGIEGF